MIYHDLPIKIGDFRVRYVNVWGIQEFYCRFTLSVVRPGRRWTRPLFLGSELCTERRSSRAAWKRTTPKRCEWLPMASRTGKIHLIHQHFVIAHNLEVYYGLLRYVLDSTAHWKISCQHIPTFPISRDFPEISRKVQVENAPTMDPSWESNKRSSCNVKFAEALRRIGLPEGHTWSVEEMGVIRRCCHQLG